MSPTNSLSHNFHRKSGNWISLIKVTSTLNNPLPSKLKKWFALCFPEFSKVQVSGEYPKTSWKAAFIKIFTVSNPKLQSVHRVNSIFSKFDWMDKTWEGSLPLVHSIIHISVAIIHVVWICFWERSYKVQISKNYILVHSLMNYSLYQLLYDQLQFVSQDKHVTRMFGT